MRRSPLCARVRHCPDALFDLVDQPELGRGVGRFEIRQRVGVMADVGRNPGAEIAHQVRRQRRAVDDLGGGVGGDDLRGIGNLHAFVEVMAEARSDTAAKAFLRRVRQHVSRAHLVDLVARAAFQRPFCGRQIDSLEGRADAEEVAVLEAGTILSRQRRLCRQLVLLVPLAAFLAAWHPLWLGEVDMGAGADVGLLLGVLGGLDLPGEADRVLG